MSKIMVLSVGFGDSDANSICTKQLIDGLHKKGNTVDLYCIKKSIKNEDIKTEFGNVFYFYNEYTDINCYFEKRGKDVNKLPKFLKYSIKITRRIKSIFYPKTGNVYGDTIKRRALFSKVKEENAKSRYDLIIAVVQPFGFAILASKIKKLLNNVPDCYLYMLDPYVFNYTMPASKTEKRKKQFEKYTCNYDGMIITRGIYEETQRKQFQINKKHVVVDLPNLVENKAYEIRNNYPDKTEVLFAGWFYKDIRNPELMFRVFEKLFNINENLALTLFSRGCNDIVNDFAKKYSDRVNLCGIVTHQELQNYTRGVNILLNLGNSIVNQLPSKVFEYIAIGKPIINFYFNDDDTSLYYLIKYPLAYNFKLTNYKEEDISDLNRFIVENFDKHISYDEATVGMQEARAENVIAKIIEFIF